MEAQKISLGEELKAHVTIALPLAAAFLAQIGMALTDNAIVGRLGSVQLAAIGLTGNLLWEVLIVAISIVSVVGVLIAQSFGAKQHEKIAHHVRQGFWVALVLSIPGTLLCYHATRALALTNQNPQVLLLGEQYLHAAAWSFLPALMFTVLRSYTASLSRVTAVMVITLTAVGLNAILTYSLVFGVWGLPALGIKGAGWATTAVNWIMLLSMLIYTARSEGLRRYRVYQNLFDLDITECWQIVRLGLPLGGIALLEGGLFMAIAVLMGTIGVYALAANQVVINAIAVTFMISLAIGEAAGIRVAHGIGAGNLAESRQSGLLGLGLGIVSGSFAGLAFIFGSHFLTGFFLDINDPENAQVIALCASLFMIAATFQLFDGLQAIAVRALRGMKDVMVPMWIAALGYWVFGIGGGYTLAFVLDYGPQGLWWGLATGLTIAGILLSSRFLILSREYE